MSVISMDLIKKLRDATQIGFLECKKALVEAEGDYQKALDQLRIRGAISAIKKQDRVAAHGVVLARGCGMIEVNCETDFVGRNENFQTFAKSLLDLVLVNKLNDVETLSALEIDGKTVDAWRLELIAAMGENIRIRRCAYMENSEHKIASYQHGQRIGVLVLWDGEGDVTGEEMAMQIAASNPMAIDKAGIDEAVLEHERSIAAEKVKEMGKPENISASIVSGMVAKFVDANTLLGQEFIMDNKLKVGEVLATRKSLVLKFLRFELGEGIEVVVENLAEVVRKMNEGNA